VDARSIHAPSIQVHEPPMKVLVVEDSERLQRSLRHGLERSGFAVDVVGRGDDGLAHAQHGTYDVMVLDLMLPGLDGLTVLRRLREAGHSLHVLILSARDRVDERVAGLHSGADDYLPKPFELDELVARLRALVRRKYQEKDPIHRVGDLTVDTGRRTARVGDREVQLTAQEYSVLDYLLHRRGRVVSKRELVDHLYAGSARGSENAVEVFVHQMRRKLRDVACGNLIRTRRGHGYVMD